MKKLKEIEKKEDLLEYLEQKGKNHKYYKNYLSEEKIIKNIIKYNAIFLSDGKDWNDKEDEERLCRMSKKEKNFAICFSASQSESVAMWMLYSRNNGYMIDFKKSIIKSILQAKIVEIGNFNENDEFIVDKIIDKENFEIKIMDILYYQKYCSDNDETMYVKHMNEINNKLDPKLINFDDDIFIKTIPWSYESECRIIVTIKNSSFKKEKCYIKINFDKKLLCELKSRIYDSPNSKKGKYCNSDLKGKINWNLCKNCEYYLEGI